MSSLVVSPSVTFIDLATYSELEGFLYGGPEAITIFVRAVQKANWFSIVPISLRPSNTIDFGQKKLSVVISRGGDYVMNSWFRCQIPQITLDSSADLFATASIRWTRNLMHNLFERINITFNDLAVEEFDNYWLDFNYQFRLPGSKRVGYRNMIGDILEMTQPVGIGFPLGTGGYFQVPFPFWFGEDSGVALPIAALPFNEIRIQFDLRSWQELLVVYPGTAGGAGTNSATIQNVILFDQTGSISLGKPEVFVHYAIVHNDERVMMGDAPRDMLDQEVQATALAPFKDVTTQNEFDIRLSFAIRAVFFAARNNSYQAIGSQYGNEWSNYTTAPNYSGVDPIATATMRYENSPRFSMGADYFSLTAPYYFSSAIPDETGYHMYSYATNPWSQDPLGSTNFTKLANVSMHYLMSPACQAAANATSPVDAAGNPIVIPNTSGVNIAFPQTFEHVFQAQNSNIIRVANGSLAKTTL